MAAHTNDKRIRFIDEMLGQPGAPSYSLAQFEDLLVKQGLDVSRRSLQHDIRRMLKLQGQNLEAMRRGRVIYYRYKDPNQGISRSLLPTSDLDIITMGLHLVERYGLYQEAARLRLRLNKNLPELDQKPGLHFDDNADYEGLKWLAILHRAILNKRVVRITYQPLTDRQKTVDMHPYQLREYNMRWYICGLIETAADCQHHVPLDRIMEVNEVAYIPFKETPFPENYYDDCIGLSQPETDSVQKVELLFSKGMAPYISAKPLHPSQQVPSNRQPLDGGLYVTVNLKVNPELETVLLGFGGDVEVLAPESLRKSLVEKIEKALAKYRAS